jgi:hypothetical protein
VSRATEAEAVRRAARTDANQQAIVDALRAAGASVEVIGKPVDLLVGYRGRNLLVECKDGQKTPGNRPLTKAQREFIPDWRGQVVVVLDAAHALRALEAA